MLAQNKLLVGATCFMAVLLGLVLFTQDADAGRLGGGKSFGRQSQNVTRQQSSPAPQQPAQGAAPAPAQPVPATPQPAGGRWLGALGGIAAGLGIGALLAHFGLMGPFAAALGGIFILGMLIVVGIVLWRLFTARASTPPADRISPIFQKQSAAAMQSAGSASPTNVYGAPLGDASAVRQGDSTWSVPADFDMDAFLRSAKVYFTRLQAAWDAGNFEDIRRFTTPEAFAEIKMQKDEGSNNTGKTEVEQLDAALLGIETLSSEYLASVRFSGRLREDGGNPEPFEEIWNLTKPVDGRGGWLLAGIQQVH